jgi:hypothetical protein
MIVDGKGCPMKRSVNFQAPRKKNYGISISIERVSVALVGRYGTDRRHTMVSCSLGYRRFAEQGFGSDLQDRSEPAIWRLAVVASSRNIDF